MSRFADSVSIGNSVLVGNSALIRLAAAAAPCGLPWARAPAAPRGERTGQDASLLSSTLYGALRAPLTAVYECNLRERVKVRVRCARRVALAVVTTH